MQVCAYPHSALLRKPPAEPVRLSDPSAFGLFLHMSCPKPVDLFPRHGMYHSVALDFVDVRSDIMHLLQAAVWACGRKG